MPWLMLTPREVEDVFRDSPNLQGNSPALRAVQERLNRLTGEVTLSDEQLDACRAGRTNWRGGHERAMNAIVRAADRMA
jgi:hypothetical protein